MKISIALAVYNGGKYLQEQLDSFLKQTRLPDELVISDDGSTDDTMDIAERFKKEAPFDVILLRNQERLGYPGNFNRALLATTGTLVFLSDQDDVWFPNKISVMSSIAENEPHAQVVMCNAALTDESLREVGLTKLDQIRAAGLPDSAFVMGCCAAVRRTFLHLSLPIPDSYPAHDDWIVRMAEGVGEKKITDEVLQFYRRHGLNQSDFFANSLVKVSWVKIFKQRCLNLVQVAKGVGALSYMEQMRRMTLFTDGVKAAALRCETDCERWSYFSDEVRVNLHELEAKADLYKYSRPRRIPMVVMLWLRGHYKRPDEPSSAIRDLLTPKN